MALTRAQLISGNSSQGVVLANQVQGVKQGSGVIIAADGTISFDPTTATGLLRLNNPLGYNGYIWPSAVGGAGQVLQGDGLGNLTWVSQSTTLSSGLGVTIDGTFLKVSIPTASTPPTVGAGAVQAIVGSLYWNNTLNQLFIYYTNGGTPVWVQAAPSATSGGGGSGAIVFPPNPALQTPVNTFSTTSTPLANTSNSFTYTWNGTAWTSAAAGGGGTVTSLVASTGLTGGTITTSGTIALANTAVTAGSYTAANITIDAQGRITAAANGSGGGGGSGTVTSVGIIGTSGVGVVSGSPVTAAGSITLAIDIATLPVLP